MLKSCIVCRFGVFHTVVCDFCSNVQVQYFVMYPIVLYYYVCLPLGPITAKTSPGFTKPLTLSRIFRLSTNTRKLLNVSVIGLHSEGILTLVSSAVLLPPSLSLTMSDTCTSFSILFILLRSD